MELDACGIGFVARATGESSREIVELALTGLACVRHRQAVAADGLSGDGAGLLVPLPRDFFARVAREAFGQRGRSRPPRRRDRVPRPRRRRRAAGREGGGGRGVRGRRARARRVARRSRSTRPSSARPPGSTSPRSGRRSWPCRTTSTRSKPTGARFRARRARRGAAAATPACAHYFASWSFSTVTYKALVISDRLAEFYPDLDAPRLRRAAGRVPQPLLHQHHAGVGAGPAVPPAVPQRRDQHRAGQRAAAWSPAAASAPRRPASAPRSCSGPLLDPDDSDSGKLDAAVELLVRGGRDIRHAVAMLVPEAWEGQRDLPAGVRDFYRYHACLTEPWDGPAGLVFTDGRRVGAALDRNGLRPLRWQVLRRRARRVRVRGRRGADRRATARSAAAGSARARCSASTPTLATACRHDATVKRWLAAPRHRTRRGRATACVALPLGPPVDEPPGGRRPPPQPGRVRGHQGGGGDGAQAHGHRRQGAHVLDGRRHAVRRRGDRGPGPVFNFLKQRFAQVTQPADRPPPRAAGDVAAHLPRARASRCSANGRARRGCWSCRRSSCTRRASSTCSTPTARRSPRRASTRRSPSPTARPGSSAASPRWPTPPTRAVAGGAAILVVSDAGIGPDRAPIPSLLATGAVHHRLVADAHCGQDASIVVDSGDARDVARGRVPARVRRRRDLPAPRARERRARWPTTTSSASCRLVRGAGEAPGRASRTAC